MSFENIDALLNEADAKSGETKKVIMPIRGVDFELPVSMPAKAVMKFVRNADTNEMKAIDEFLRGVLGDEQLDVLLDMISDVEKLGIIVGAILQFYAPKDSNPVKTNPNQKARQVRKSR